MLEQTVEGIEDIEAIERRKQHVVLRPHTFYGLKDALYFPDKHWEGLLSKRGALLEEVGYAFLRRSEAPTPICRSLGMFRAKAGTGSIVEVSSDPRVVEAINILTSRHHSLTVAPYHTHTRLTNLL